MKKENKLSKKSWCLLIEIILSSATIAVMPTAFNTIIAPDDNKSIQKMIDYSISSDTVFMI